MTKVRLWTSRVTLRRALYCLGWAGLMLAVMLPSSAVLADEVLADEVLADSVLAGELLTEPPRGSSFQADIRLGITKTAVPGSYHLDISFDRDDLIAVLVRSPTEDADLVRYATKGFSEELTAALGKRETVSTLRVNTPTLEDGIRFTVDKELSELEILGVTIVTQGGEVLSQDYRPQSFERCSLAVRFHEGQERCREVENDCDVCSVTAFCCGGGAPCSGCSPNCWIACPPCIEPSF
ncbi:MAG: hypothetical protein AAGD01_04165 [Acidobacteriota bacterium]